MFSKLKKYQTFWNMAAVMYKFVPLRIFKKLPKAIFIETTNTCNIRCPNCPTHSVMKREKGFMEFELFQSIIDEFSRNPSNKYWISSAGSHSIAGKDLDAKPEIFMHFAGEPILNKDIAQMIEYASKKGHKSSISTNAVVLPKDLSYKLIQAGLTSIHLCLDGITKRSHEAYRVGSDFEKVKENIENFLLAKRELKKNNPEVCIQTLLTSFSENEIDEMTAWAKKIRANSINFKSLSMGSFTSKKEKEKYSYLLPKKKELQRKTSNIYKTLCSWPRDNAVVYWNGNLGLCCIDFDNEIKLPNIKEKGFLRTFFSNEVIKMRKFGLQKKFALCKRCSLGNADFMGININFKK